MSAKKIRLQVEMEYVQEKLRTGEASLQEISLKAIGEIDHTFQARVIPINMEHVKTLASIRDSGKKLDPIVIFRDRDTGAMKVADGFHRHEEARRRKDVSIMAYLIETSDIEADGIYFSTMCNQMTLLRRTTDDCRKAIMMLLSRPEWFNKSSQMIAEHIGMSYTKLVDDCRREFCMSRRRPEPKFTVGKDGVVRPRGAAREKCRGGALRGPYGNGAYVTTIRGKQFYLGSNEIVAKEKLRCLLEVNVETSDSGSSDHSSMSRSEAIAQARIFGDSTPGNGWRRLLWRMADLLENPEKS